MPMYGLQMIQIEITRRRTFFNTQLDQLTLCTLKLGAVVKT